MPTQFTIFSNNYLRRNAIGYFNQPYTGHRRQNNPDFLNILKNTFNDIVVNDLNNAKVGVHNILLADIPYIMRRNAWNECVCVCVPRAKALGTYLPNQLFFRDAVSSAASQILPVVDGSNFITRHTNTRTTHLREHIGRTARQGQIRVNDGVMPYPGITNATCTIEADRINAQNIILIDDIYTRNINIDEDCIQALLDNMARDVIFYAIACTGRG